MGLYWDMIPSPVGNVYLEGDGTGCLHRIVFCDDDDNGESHAAVSSARRDAPALRSVAQQLQAYFSGRKKQFDVNVHTEALPPFWRKVLDATVNIDYGTTMTYKQVAVQVGSPAAARAVGQALANNPIPIVIPCHRVIGSNGSLTGFSALGGLDAKQWLLQHEATYKGS